MADKKSDYKSKFLPLFYMQKHEPVVKSEPVINSFSCNLTGQTATINISAEDYMGSEVEINVDWGNGVQEGWQWATQATYTYTYIGATTSPTVYVRDACCQKKVLTCDFVPSENVITVNSVSCPSNLEANQVYTFSANATSSQGLPLDYTFTFSDGTVATGTNNSYAWSTPNEGSYSMVLTISCGTSSVTRTCVYSVGESTELCQDVDLNKKYSIVDTDLIYFDNMPTGIEVDDIQSLATYLCFTDLICNLGFVSTRVNGGAQASSISRWIKWFNLDFLRAKGFDVIPEATALSQVSQGALSAGAPSASRATAGSNAIVNAVKAHKAKFADCPTTPKIWIQVWGPITTTAQAMFQILQEDASLADCINIYAIGNFNTFLDEDSANWMIDNLSQFPNTTLIYNNESFQGMYKGVTGQYSPQTFMQQCIRGKGTVGTTPEGQILGDAMPVPQPPFTDAINGYKGGDDPSWLYLLSCALGLSDSNNPADQNSLGGWFTNVSGNYWHDTQYNTNANNPSLHARVNQKIQQIYDLYCDCFERFDS